MKNELDRQLKAQWEAASVEDFGIDIDTEKLWHKITRPGKPQTIRLSWLKYAVALLIGAMVTFGLMQWKAPRSYALRPGMDRLEARQAAFARQETRTPQEEQHGQVSQKQAATPGYISPASRAASIASKTGTITKKESLKEEQIMPESPAPAARESVAQVPTRSQPARKTIHLLDLEKPAAAPKPGKLMMAIEEHLRPKSDDIAFSTKILTRQF